MRGSGRDRGRDTVAKVRDPVDLVPESERIRHRCGVTKTQQQETVATRMWRRRSHNNTAARDSR